MILASLRSPTKTHNQIPIQITSNSTIKPCKYSFFSLSPQPFNSSPFTSSPLNPHHFSEPASFSLLIRSISSMDAPVVQVGEPQQPVKHVYSVWALPPEDVRERLKELMARLRSEFGGPKFEPHITVVGAISLTEDDALEKFRAACQGVKAYAAAVEKVATGTFFYQCVFLLLHPTPEVVEASSHCTSHFGFKSSTPYMPHLSILYGDLTDEEKKKAQERANILDDSIGSLSFPITRLALYETDTEDTTLKSWKRIAECNLDAN